MNARTLVLTPWYAPYRVVSWQDAVTMLYLKKVEVIASYDELVASPSTTWALPAVIRMFRKMVAHRARIRFSRVNVFTRDNFHCMYCGRGGTARELTLDHVVPRSQGGRTEWENILTACVACNTLKGGRTPLQAGMRPMRTPSIPKSLPSREPRLDQTSIPKEWEGFCAQMLPRPEPAAASSFVLEAASSSADVARAVSSRGKPRGGSRRATSG